MEHRERLGSCEYVWDEGCFPLTQDSLALAAFCKLRPGLRLCDLGCGAGAVGLALLAREPSLHMTGVEADGHAAECARRNLTRNGLSGEILTADLTCRADLPSAGSFDLAVANPPYFPSGSGGDGGGARMEGRCTPQALCAAAAYLLKNGGRFALIQRAERLCDLMCALRGAGLEPKRMKLLTGRADKAPYAVLLEAVHQGKPGLKIEQ